MYTSRASGNPTLSSLRKTKTLSVSIRKCQIISAVFTMQLVRQILDRIAGLQIEHELSDFLMDQNTGQAGVPRDDLLFYYLPLRACMFGSHG